MKKFKTLTATTLILLSVGFGEGPQGPPKSVAPQVAVTTILKGQA